MHIEDTSNVFIKQLTDNFLSSVLSQVQSQALNAVQEQIDSIDVIKLFEQEMSSNVIPTLTEEIKNKIKSDVTTIVSNLDFNSMVNTHLINSVIPRIELYGRDIASKEITNKLNALNSVDIVIKHTDNVIKNALKTADFPDLSIPGRAIDPKDLIISGTNIQGGIIKNFESTGIQDSATQCQVTILDDATVFENKLVSTALEVTGDTVFLGNITVAGEIPNNSPFVKKIANLVSDAFTQEYSDGNFDNYCNRTINLIKTQGLSAEHVKTNDGSSLVDGIKLANSITRSNLQTVGPLKELQVIGETVLDDTVFVSNKRIGINTVEPERTLDMWDHEVQIIAGKKMQDTAVFGTIRNQNLVLTANNKDQLVLNVDGSVTIKTLNIGKSVQTSANRRPTDNKPAATIVWNENPVIGSPVAWVSLGGARWAPFGIING
jgi:hypothetical protein